jgi:hypothetical protein
LRALHANYRSAASFDLIDRRGRARLARVGAPAKAQRPKAHPGFQEGERARHPASEQGSSTWPLVRASQGKPGHRAAAPPFPFFLLLFFFLYLFHLNKY